MFFSVWLMTILYITYSLSVWLALSLHPHWTVNFVKAGTFSMSSSVLCPVSRIVPATQTLWEKINELSTQIHMCSFLWNMERVKANFLNVYEHSQFLTVTLYGLFPDRWRCQFPEVLVPEPPLESSRPIVTTRTDCLYCCTHLGTCSISWKPARCIFWFSCQIPRAIMCTLPPPTRWFLCIW